LPYPARLFHAEVRGNVAFGEAGFEHGLGDGGGWSAWRVGCQWIETEDENKGDGQERYARRFDHD